MEPVPLSHTVIEQLQLTRPELVKLPRELQGRRTQSRRPMDVKEHHLVQTEVDSSTRKALRAFHQLGRRQRTVEVS